MQLKYAVGDKQLQVPTQSQSMTCAQKALAYSFCSSVTSPFGISGCSVSSGVHSLFLQDVKGNQAGGYHKQQHIATSSTLCTLAVQIHTRARHHAINLSCRLRTMELCTALVNTLTLQAATLKSPVSKHNSRMPCKLPATCH